MALVIGSKLCFDTLTLAQVSVRLGKRILVRESSDMFRGVCLFLICTYTSILKTNSTALNY